MRNYLLFQLFIVVSMLMNSCAPQPVFRFEPVGANTKWLKGREYIESVDQKIKVSVGFVKTINYNVAFDIEVTNKSDSLVTVSPEKFYYIANLSTDTSSVSDSLPLTGSQTHALDPESNILQIDKRSEKRKADIETENCLQTLSCMANFLGDATSERTREEQEKEDERREKEMQEHEESLRSYEAEIAGLKNIRMYWVKATLRKTTLEPNQSIKGKVHFPLNRKAKSVTLIISIKESSNRFTFRQHKF